jgi:hypothetical protein
MFQPAGKASVNALNIPVLPVKPYIDSRQFSSNDGEHGGGYSYSSPFISAFVQASLTGLEMWVEMGAYRPPLDSTSGGPSQPANEDTEIATNNSIINDFRFIFELLSASFRE